MKTQLSNSTSIEGKNTLIKKLLPYLIAIAVFIALTLAYCSPIVFQGKVLQQSDVNNWKGMVQESKTFSESTGIHPWWTGSMFSGMPTYQIGNNEYASTPLLKPFVRITRIGFTGTLALVIGYFLCFFILLRSFKINNWICIIGSIAITFSSYFFIIIQAGHVTKAATIALMAPVVAGFYLIFNKKYGWGVAFTMIYTAIGFMQHPQMSYYICMLIGILFIAEVYQHVKEKKYKDLGIATIVFVASLLVGLGTGSGKILANQEYAKETMRGGHSELVKANDKTNKTSGLDLDYATQWSYGIDETMTLLIPNYMGGSSHYNAGTDSKVYEALIKNRVPKNDAANFAEAIPAYWGKQPFTSGPVYVGAIVCFLFVLGLFIVKGPYKWALLAATLFSIMLAWGKNFMGLTRFFFDFFPMYDKFRTVSSILIVAEITMPLLAFLAIKAMMDKEISKKELLKNIYISAGITGGLCLIIALFGGLFYDFTSPNDAQYVSQLPSWAFNAILAERSSMMRTDAMRSLLFIVLSAGALWLFVNEKMKFGYFAVILGLLIVFDMWPVNKRFFNNSDFVSKKQSENYFKEQAYEKAILQDKDPNFRVLNLTTSTFNDSRTSYRLKSIGGYHGAKLRRYQDLIEEHISKNNMEVVNMLNTKYFVVKGSNGTPTAQRNLYAYGNAWFVDTVALVNTPNEESEALNKLNLRTQAVADAKFANVIGNTNPVLDENASIKLTSYTPDILEYTSTSTHNGVGVFSEIYYPYGWKAFIDNQPVEHFRADYTLRALNIPAGTHQIRFEFKPDSVKKGNIISLICIFIMNAALIGFVVYYFLNTIRKRQAH